MKPLLDVVVTGLGVVSPIGIGLDPFWSALRRGISGVSVRPSFAHTSLPFRIGGAVRDFDPKLYVKPRKSLKVMCPQIQFGYAAAQMAVEHAGLSPGSYNPDRLGSVFGSETFYADPEEVALVFRKCIVNRCYDHERWGEFSMRDIMPLWMLKYLPNMVASHISIACDARGPSNTICQAEVGGQLALIEAVDIIQRGAADVVIVGGTGSPMETASLLNRGWHSLSRRIDDPQRACRPFDAARDGVVMGEGAGAVVLERADFASARGAKAWARIAATDRRFFPPGHSDFAAALSQALTDAIRDAGADSRDIGHVNAGASGSVSEDAVEAQAIRRAVGDVPVIALKSYFGNIGPGTSLVELIGSIGAIQASELPATLNYETPDPACPINVSAQPATLSHRAPFVKLSWANTGQIATVVVA
jgi:3-oxoacyl-[acyl-carrier-protein] synthase II